MNLCKPLDPLRLSGNNDKNWHKFKEQLVWFLEGTESTGKSDGAKIGTIMRHAISCRKGGKRALQDPAMDSGRRR